MNRPEPTDPNLDNAGHSPTPLSWTSFAAVAVVLLTGCLSMFTVLQLDAFQPQVGDIVAMKPGSQDTDAWQMTIPATLVSARGTPMADCALDPNVMAEKGGSLVVEASLAKPQPRYRVHWEGGETARAADGCGASATVLVTRVDLQRLANAAGGFGVGNKGIVR
jgi:hypothetical protein